MKLSPLARALFGYVAGCLAIVAGVWIEFGAGYGLIAAGAAAVASFLLLADVEGDEDGEAP
ncbi:hypothetical protein ACIBI9_04145 [Nonomuraea sp. NPDC050451]|uniref:hypothetical protein n=1 Tax=Nonomuraea sp. NPDC050451 TaxID=3364364 RepID=UPI00379FE858